MLTRILIIAALVVGLLLAWDFVAGFFAPPSQRAEVAKELMTQAADRLVEEVGKERLAVLELLGDHESEVSNLLYETLKLRDSAVVFGELIKGKKLNEDGSPAAEEVRRFAADDGVRYMLSGRVESYAHEGLDVNVAVKLVLTDTENGTEKYHNTFGEHKKAGWLENVRHFVGSLPWLLRLVGWLLLVALLPLLLQPLLQSGVEAESNVINAFMLGGMTLVGGLLAWLALGYGASMLVEIIVLLVAVAVSGTYYYVVLDRLAH
jgi:hypothetical protein